MMYPDVKNTNERGTLLYHTGVSVLCLTLTQRCRKARASPGLSLDNNLALHNSVCHSIGIYMSQCLMGNVLWDMPLMIIAHKVPMPRN